MGCLKSFIFIKMIIIGVILAFVMRKTPPIGDGIYSAANSAPLCPFDKAQDRKGGDRGG